jgi:bifunctional DNA-binding transcriptional regulator/antitoxin component of YhaV-PrlF toxin-antitoxin module
VGFLLVKEPESTGQFIADVDARGRLVLPGPVRRHLNLAKGDGVILTISKDSVVQLCSRKGVAAKFRGLYQRHSSKSSMVDELIVERRQEAAKQDAK